MSGLKVVVVDISVVTMENMTNLTLSFDYTEREEIFRKFKCWKIFHHQPVPHTGGQSELQPLRLPPVLPEPPGQETARHLRPLRQVRGGQQAGPQDQDHEGGAEPHVGRHIRGGAVRADQFAGGEGLQSEPSEGRPPGPGPGLFGSKYDPGELSASPPPS